MQPVEFTQVYAAVPEDGIILIDGIKTADGAIWLIPEWIDGYPTAGFSRPARMIRPLSAQYSQFLGRLLLQGTLPKDALSNEPPPGYEVVLLPDLFVAEGARGLEH